VTSDRPAPALPVGGATQYRRQQQQGPNAPHQGGSNGTTLLTDTSTTQWSVR